MGDLLDVDLRKPGVSVGLLRPPVIAARRTVSEMADARQAVAGVNGDFFNISETHPGVVPTGASSGPEVDGGRPIKGAVPDGQRFGPALPPGVDRGRDRHQDRPARACRAAAPDGEHPGGTDVHCSPGAQPVRAAGGERRGVRFPVG